MVKEFKNGMSTNILKKPLRGVKRIITLSYSTLRSIGMKKYGISKFYICNVDFGGKAIPYFDSPEAASIYQHSVYTFARDLMVEHGLLSLLDIGCGTGVKLAEIIHPVCQDITGIDGKHCIDICKQQHSFGRWLTDDIENPTLSPEKTFDLIISSDVVEHLINPDFLLAYIKRYANENTWIVISTPERDMVRGKRHFGPAPNRAHVREWNMAEFYRYIDSNGFEILDHFLTGSEKNVADRKTQVVLCKIKKRPAYQSPAQTR
jgi:SAM-dependent methyltransferase